MKLKEVLLFVTVSTMLLASLFSCSENPASPGGNAPQNTWVAWENPIVIPEPNYNFSALWGDGDGTIYVVGGAEMVLRFDGRNWEIMHQAGMDQPYSADPSFPPHLTHGTSEQSLWVHHSVSNSGSEYLYDIWGDSHGELYAVGSNGIILHYDGSDWEEMDSGTSENLHGIWGEDDDAIYAVGEGGTVLYCNGWRWQTIDTGTELELLDVWGDSRHTFAVGEGGIILELDRNSALEIPSITTNRLVGIGGCRETGLYAVGHAGTILHYDGSGWYGVRSGIMADLYKICGMPDGQLIATGTKALLHFDGSEWHPVYEYDLSLPYSFGDHIDIWGGSIRDLFLLSYSSILHLDGSTWEWQELPPLPRGNPGDSGKTLLAIWGDGGSTIYAASVGEGVRRYDGSNWTSIGGGSVSALWGMPGDTLFSVKTNYYEEYLWPDGRHEWTVATLSRYSGGAWSDLQASQDLSFKSVWCASGTDLFIAGSTWQFHFYRARDNYREWIECHPRVFRYTDGVWSQVFSSDSLGRLNDIWGSSSSNVYAVGSDGLIVHFDGTGWTEMESGVTTGLVSLWGASDSEIFATGYNGVILHCDGQLWTTMSSGTAETLYDIWGSSAGDLFAVGAKGTILHYDGVQWRQVPSPTVNHLYGIWGNAPDDVFAVGQYGTILHHGSE